jgi:hypothetical protein
MFCKYPNPFCSHVLSSDMVDRYIDESTGQLVTVRLFEKSSRLVPPWIAAVSHTIFLFINLYACVDFQD